MESFIPNGHSPLDERTPAVDLASVCQNASPGAGGCFLGVISVAASGHRAVGTRHDQSVDNGQGPRAEIPDLHRSGSREKLADPATDKGSGHIQNQAGHPDAFNPAGHPGLDDGTDNQPQSDPTNESRGSPIMHQVSLLVAGGSNTGIQSAQPQYFLAFPAAAEQKCSSLLASSWLLGRCEERLGRIGGHRPGICNHLSLVIVVMPYLRAGSVCLLRTVLFPTHHPSGNREDFLIPRTHV